VVGLNAPVLVRLVQGALENPAVAAHHSTRSRPVRWGTARPRSIRVCLCSWQIEDCARHACAMRHPPHGPQPARCHACMRVRLCLHEHVPVVRTYLLLARTCRSHEPVVRTHTVLSHEPRLLTRSPASVAATLGRLSALLGLPLAGGAMVGRRVRVPGLGFQGTTGGGVEEGCGSAVSRLGGWVRWWVVLIVFFTSGLNLMVGEMVGGERCLRGSATRNSVGSQEGFGLLHGDSMDVVQGRGKAK
jgi:hypothetical protein